MKKTTRIIYKKRQLKQLARQSKAPQKASFFGDPAAAPTLRLAEGVFLPTMKTMSDRVQPSREW